MKRWVMLGGGPNHYELIRNLVMDPVDDFHILLVSSNSRIQNYRTSSQRFFNLLSEEESALDLWKICQKASVDFIDDSIIRLDKGRQVVELQNNGPMPFDELTIECMGESLYPGFSVQPMPSVAPLYPMDRFLKSMNRFAKEVHRHAPRELEIVFSGNSLEVCHWALILKNVLGKKCMGTRIRIVSADKNFLPHVNSWHRRSFKKILNTHGIEWIGESHIDSLQPHRITFSSGLKIEMDVFIPGENLRPSQVYQRVLAGMPTHIPVDSFLRLRGEKNIIVHGDCLWSHSQSQRLHSDLRGAQQKYLVENLCGRGRKKRKQSPYAEKSIGIETMVLEESKALTRKNGLLKVEPMAQHELRRQALWHMASQKKVMGTGAVSDKQARQQDEFEAYHSRRPWENSHQMPEEISGEERLQQVCTIGYNWWGDTARSSQYLTQLVLAKALCQGIVPESVRISLVIPEDDPIWAQHLFKTSLKAVESVLEKEGVGFAGGDTMKGPHWSLNLTVAGPRRWMMSSAFSKGDYLLLTRPLGLGLLWSRRTHECFKSQWFEDAVDYPVCPGVLPLAQFFKKFKVSTAVMIEEWGLLYHSLLALGVDQQLLINFRNLPKWQGVDEVLETPASNKALDKNWQRIRSQVNFDRDHISKGNAILWDPRSHGAMVLAVSSSQCDLALASLQKMGFTEATLVGCVREQFTNKKMVLSDWNGGLQT